MFIIKFLGLAAIVYAIITIAIPSMIGAYYGATLWKKYSGFYNVVPKETVDEWFQLDIQLHLFNNPYIRFINRF